jgi:hypothetical protein
MVRTGPSGFFESRRKTPSLIVGGRGLDHATSTLSVPSPWLWLLLRHAYLALKQWA